MSGIFVCKSFDQLRKTTEAEKNKEKTGKKLRKQTKEKNKEKPSSAASMLRKKCPSSGKLSHHQKSIVTSKYTSVYSSVVEGSKD